MIVTCPGCNSNYRVKNESVPTGGAKMRCPKCQTMFLAVAPPGKEGAEPEPPPPPKADKENSGIFDVSSLRAPNPSENIPFASTRPSGALPKIPPPVGGLSSGAPSSFPPPSSSAFPPPSPGAPGAFPTGAAPFSPASSFATPSTGAFPGAPGTSPFAATPGTGGFPTGPGSGAFPTTPRTGSFPAAPGTGSGAPHSASTSIEQLMSSLPPSAAPSSSSLPPGFSTSPPTGPGPQRTMTRPFGTDLFPAWTPDAAQGAGVIPPAAPPPAPAVDPFAAAAPPTPPPRETSDANDLFGGASSDDELAVATEPPREARVPGATPPPTTTATSTKTTRTTSTPLRRPSRVGEALGAVALALGLVVAVGGGVFSAWTARALDLDAALLPVLETELGIVPPLSFTGRDDPVVDDLRAKAAEAKGRGDLVAEAVALRRVLALGPDDASKARLVEVVTALGLPPSAAR